MRKLTDNFNLIEFQSKDGSIMPWIVEREVEKTAINLQLLRNRLNTPLHINSAYRSPVHNRRVGGAEHSKHLLGIAVDITSKNKTPRQLYKIISKMIRDEKIKEGGLGLYKGFVHYDTRGTRARWNKTNIPIW